MLAEWAQQKGGDDGIVMVFDESHMAKGLVAADPASKKRRAEGHGDSDSAEEGRDGDEKGHEEEDGDESFGLVMNEAFADDDEFAHHVGAYLSTQDRGVRLCHRQQLSPRASQSCSMKRATAYSASEGASSGEATQLSACT